MIVLAKINKRLTVKGFVDYENRQIIEFDKDDGEIRHSFDNIFIQFNGLDDVTLTLSHDKIIEVED